jgi:hypothetical protein
MSIAQNEQDKTQETLLKFMAAKRLTAREPNPDTTFRIKQDLLINEYKTLLNLLEQGLVSKDFFKEWGEQVLDPAADQMHDELHKEHLELWKDDGYYPDFNQWRREKFAGLDFSLLEAEGK